MLTNTPIAYPMSEETVIVKTRPKKRAFSNPDDECLLIEISYDTLMPIFQYPLEVAAKKLGICETALKG